MLAGNAGPEGASFTPTATGGPRGATGVAGSQGAVDATGARGGELAVDSWTFYRRYTFSSISDLIMRADGSKALEVAYYVQQNPASRVALDGTNDRRVGAVRLALLDSGVPAGKITIGAFGDAKVRSNGGVVVLVSK